MKRKFFIPLIALLIVACGRNNSNKTKATSGNDSAIVKTAKAAYVFGIPLVLMDVSRRQFVSANSTAANHGPANQFFNMAEFPDASFKDVVRANADTYYSTAWLDLEKEPLILTVPDTRGRYYMMPMLDAYTNVFASPGKRTTGTRAGNFLISGPKWRGTVPKGVKQIKAPTNMVWIVGRTQVNSKEDGDNVVVPIQKQYKLIRLSAWGKSSVAPVMTEDPGVPNGSPNDVLKNMPVEEFFNYINKLMAANPPAATDSAAIAMFDNIGIGPGKNFKLSSFSADVQKSIKLIPQQITAGINESINKPAKLINGWKPMPTNIGVYGTHYLDRAFVAFVGLGANLPADAVYPSCANDGDGHKLNGANNYLLHFNKGETPPNNAFWSLTMYDPDGFMIANPLNRNTIGDRSKLKANADGSVDIYIQHKSPGKDKEINWLPAPATDFNILLRVYWPKQIILNGGWKVPPVKKVS